jgi:MoxR-like ATPase
MQKLWDRFHQRIPGFTDFRNPGSTFIREETAYKRRLLAKFQESLGREKLAALVDTGEGRRAKQEIMRCLTSNIVSFHAWNPTFGETDSVICDVLREYLTATASPYQAPSSTRSIFEVCERHGLKPSWDAVSTLLWALRPEDFFPIKISYYRELAAELGHKLPGGRPNADALHEIIEFGRAFADALKPQNPADWVDIQSFIWCVCPGKNAKSAADDTEELDGVGDEFLAIMRRYCDDHTVFCSAQRGARYAIQNVDENGCTVARLDGGEVERCTTSLLADKLHLIRSKDGAHSFDNSFASTSAIRNCLLQSNRLALSADKSNILDVTNPERALQVFSDTLKTLRVDVSSGQPKLYKPAMVACVLEGIRNRELTENKIPFDWIAPPFLEKMAVLGEQISEREAAMPFFHLTNDLFWMLSYRDLSQLVSDGSDGPAAMRTKVSHASIKDTFWDMLQNPDHLEQAERALAAKWWPATQPLQSPSDINYWWLNANPKIWNFNDLRVGQRMTYRSYSDKGNKRQKYRYFQEVKVGDPLIGYVTSPDKEVIAICRITQGLHGSDQGERIEFEKIEQLATPIPYESLLDNPELANCEPFISNNQGSLFRLTKNEYEVIRSLIDEANTRPEVNVEPYDKKTAITGLFLEESKFDEMLDALQEKKNVVLQGAPGVGKTFVAKRLAYALMGAKDPQRVEMIQFHQSYSYEDFIEGFRPTQKGHFDLKFGLFYEFCRRARREESSQKPYVFIIDEINRGNLSKIFGELMMLIEPDKRGKEHAIPLAYSRNADEKFYIPENLYLIGTMNTADRSLAMVDYALRRRFRFITLQPEFAAKAFHKYLSDLGVESKLIDRIVRRMIALNEIIAADSKNLGPGYQVGHSYFCPRGGSKPDEEWYRRVIESEIVPLIQEYWFDNEQKVKDQRAALLS